MHIQIQLAVDKNLHNEGLSEEQSMLLWSNNNTIWVHWPFLILPRIGETIALDDLLNPKLNLYKGALFEHGLLYGQFFTASCIVDDINWSYTEGYAFHPTLYVKSAYPHEN